MRRLYFKIFLAIAPLLFIAGFYLYADPFLVVRHYNNLKETRKKHLELNQDYVETETFLENYEKAHYDSYIFGSSRAEFYFSPHIQPIFKSNAIFQYATQLESLYGVEKKLEFLDRRGAAIKNVLLVFDEQLLRTTTNNKGHLFRKHPLLSGESNIDFQVANFMDVFDRDFIVSYFKLLTQKSTTGTAPEKTFYEKCDEMIARNKDSFYNARKEYFFDRPAAQQFGKPIIESEQISCLKNISAILKKHNTSYIIIINALYDQVKLNPGDMDILYSIFDRKNIYDFSGINEITTNKYNYYESDHFRREIASKILDSINSLRK